MSEPIQHPKRLIEVDLPIKRISAHARREKSIRHGHISTLHIWWARRPLAACRAVILAALWPDPADPLCPQRFQDEAAAQLSALRDKYGGKPRDWKNPKELRQGLLDFIADFANWDLANDKDYLNVSRNLVQVAHEALGGESGTRPLVIDPFAGGGAIPLEALHVGADTFASDLNPVAVLLNKVVLEYIPKYGKRLAEEVRKWGGWIKKEAERELAQFYPLDADGSVPVAYLWARTIRCEGPGCGAEVPLLRSLVLTKKGRSSVSLRLTVEKKAKRILFDIPSLGNSEAGAKGTVKRGAAICPICGFTTSADNVRSQFHGRRGGARDARLIAVVVDGPEGRTYREPTIRDVQALKKAKELFETLKDTSAHGLKQLPDEPLPYLRSIFNIHLLDVNEWGDLFTARQALSLIKLTQYVRAAAEATKRQGYSEDFKTALLTCLGLVLDRQADRLSSLARWDTSRSNIANTFARQALGIVWDFAEANPFSGATGDWTGAVEWVAEVCENGPANAEAPGHAEHAPANKHPLPNDSAQAAFSDPPYYDAVPYADLSDFFYVWLRRTIRDVHPLLLSEQLTPKAGEAVQLAERNTAYSFKTKAYFEQLMCDSLAEARRVTMPGGIGTFVFAHKDTSAWESMLGAVLAAGWIITASWPIDTEMENRLRAMNSAALASSIHLVCRPRENPDGSIRMDSIGDFRSVLLELPKRLHEWMPRLAQEGIVGADAIFACLGPALEIFSRYSRVEKASGETVSLREYLEHVWAAVSKEALSMIFHEADTMGLEEDARLTAMWLWTLSTSGDTIVKDSDVEDEAPDDEDDEEGKVGKAKVSGFILEFDAARKIAQGLGARLESLTHVVEVKKDKARLLPVAERAQHLFGKPEAAAAAAKRAAKKKQMTLFPVSTAEEESSGWGDLGEPAGGTTILDRVHQSMLLFASGRSEALKRFLVDDGVGRQSQFWKLAQSLSALYPGGSEEKRWVDGVLARKKGLGF